MGGRPVSICQFVGKRFEVHVCTMAKRDYVSKSGMSEIEQPAAPTEHNTGTQEAAAPPPQPLPELYDDRLNPLGWEFNPSHESNVIVLRKKIAGIPVNLDKTVEVEGGFYSKPPAEIFANQPFAFKKKYLALASRSFKNKGKKCYNRSVGGSVCQGTWEGKGKLTAVLHSATGAIIGTRSRYRYFAGNTRTAKRPSGWKMTEYLSSGTPPSLLSLCCVYESQNKAEKVAVKNERRLQKAVKVAEVRAATASLRAKKTAAVAKKAHGEMLREKIRLVVRRFKRRRFMRGQGGEGAYGSAAASSSGLPSTSVVAANAAGDATAELLAAVSMQRASVDEDDVAYEGEWPGTEADCNE